MLVLSSFPNTTKDEIQGEMEIINSFKHQDFLDFSSDGNLLDGVDFDDLFIGIDHADVLPDLEMDAEIFAEYSTDVVKSDDPVDQNIFNKNDKNFEKEEYDKNSAPSCLGSSSSREGEEIVSKKDGFPAAANRGSERGKKSSSQHCNNNNKRKVKVDWTPELHRRFVQAVEQLGVDKAVPSRILELMGIDCLTRHNIASHLQKYRSHRKHLLAREAEAINWTSHKRQAVYNSAMAGGGGGGGGGGKRDIISSNWVAPAATMGFPSMTSPMHHRPPAINHFRPLHVWGHPSMSPPAWVGPHHPPPTDPSFWHPHLRVPNGFTPGPPYFPQPMATTRFAAPPVPGIPPPGLAGQPGRVPPLDIQPTKESIDAAIGDVIAKPWLPLPLGLKAPVLDSVLVELQRQGIPDLPRPR